MAGRRAGGWHRAARRLGLVGAILLLGALPRPARAQADCSAVAIRSPFAGETLAGPVEILGSASIDDFQFYKLEWAPVDEPESWRAVSTTVDRPLRNGRLDRWETAALPDGVYRLKLTVVDQQAGEACRSLVEPLWLANQAPPEPTASPTPQPSPTALPRSRGTEDGSGAVAATEVVDTEAAEVEAGVGDTASPEGAAEPDDAETVPEDGRDAAGEGASEAEGAADAAAAPAAAEPDEGEAASVPDGPLDLLQAMLRSAGLAFGLTLALALLTIFALLAGRGSRARRRS